MRVRALVLIKYTIETQALLCHTKRFVRLRKYRSECYILMSVA